MHRKVARALAILLACCWLLAACAVASETYLGWAMPCGEIRGGVGWRVRVRRATKEWGNWLVRLLGAKRALGTGGTLTLLSLALVVEGDPLSPDYKGYQIVAGSGVWPTIDRRWPEQLEVLSAQGHRVVYMLGLVVAALALAGVIPGRAGRIIRSSRILAILVGAIALLQVTSLALAFAADQYGIALWILIWAVPIAIWLKGARGGRENWDHTRLAVMAFYLPIFFLGIAFWAAFTYFAAGFGDFMVGMLLVWWGLIQSQRGIAQQQDPHAP